MHLEEFCVRFNFIIVWWTNSSFQPTWALKAFNTLISKLRTQRMEHTPNVTNKWCCRQRQIKYPTKAWHLCCGTGFQRLFTHSRSGNVAFVDRSNWMECNFFESNACQCSLGKNRDTCSQTDEFSSWSTRQQKVGRTFVSAGGSCEVCSTLKSNSC